MSRRKRENYEAKDTEEKKYRHRKWLDVTEAESGRIKKKKKEKS